MQEAFVLPPLASKPFHRSYEYTRHSFRENFRWNFFYNFVLEFEMKSYNWALSLNN